MFNKHFVAIHKIKLVSTLDKPIYVRFSILGLSKLLMYEFHCEYINKSKYYCLQTQAVWRQMM